MMKKLPTKDYVKELQTAQSWIPESRKKLKEWRDHLNDAEKQVVAIGKELLDILSDFMDANPDLYVEKFRTYCYKDAVSVSYSTSKKAFRIQTTYGLMFLVPRLLLDDPEAYRDSRVRYLEEQVRKQDDKYLKELYIQRAGIDKKIDILVSKD